MSGRHTGAWNIEQLNNVLTILYWNKSNEMHHALCIFWRWSTIRNSHAYYTLCSESISLGKCTLLYTDDECDVYSHSSCILNLNSIVELWISGIVFSFIILLHHTFRGQGNNTKFQMKRGRVLDSSDEAFQRKSYTFFPVQKKIIMLKLSARQKRNIQHASHRITKN